MKSIPILHQDDDLLIVNKPARLLVTQAPGRSGKTLLDVLRTQLNATVLPVHRLDEDVTGALLLARNEAMRVALVELFRTRQIQRRYLALLGRMPSPEAGRIESRLREEQGIVRSVVDGPGEHAVTTYRALCRVDRHVLVECQLETGRRNQIRVHMADIGCPIAGDRKYGYRAKHSQEPFRRPMLHAQELSFRHPGTAVELHVEAEAPEKELCWPQP